MSRLHFIFDEVEAARGMLVIKSNGDPQAWAVVPAQKSKRMRANTPRGKVTVLRGWK